MNRIIVVFCLFTSIVFSQQKASLKIIINQLSTQYKIAFSYNENAILYFNNVQFNNTDPLQKMLNSLSLQTHLVFEKIDTQNYIIREPSEEIVSICGKVYSQKDKNKLPFATVYFEDKSLYTNDQGEFVIDKVLKEGFITIISLGYETKNILVADFNKECNNVYLKEKVNNLSEIIITNYLTKGFSKKRDGSIVLNPKKIGTLAGVIEPDILQTLQLIPGVQSPDETASGIHIRGGTPDQNLVIFDEIKMYHFSHFFGLISAFNPYITNDVKLYRSGTHAKYGNNVGGVLDIHTDQDIPQKLTAGIGSTFTHADFYIKTPLLSDRVGLILSARRSITDIVNSITYKKYSETVFQNNKISDGLDTENSSIINANNDFFYEDYYAKAVVKPNEKNKFTISCFFNLNDLTFTGNTPNYSRVFNDNLVTNSNGFGINWEHGSLKNGFHKLLFYNTNFEKTYDGITTSNKSDATEIDDKKNTVVENSVAYQFEKNTSETSKWQFGYQFNNFDVYYDYTRDFINVNLKDILSDPIEGKTYNHSLFSEYQKKKGNWLMNLGARWQFFKNMDQSYLEPRLSLSYKVDRFLNLRASSELKHQSISQVQDFRESSLGDLFNKFWTISNQTTSPVLKSFQNGLGVSFQKKGWTIDVEPYYKYIDGVLFLFDENVRQKKNFSGTNTVYGIDVLLKKKWRNYNTWVSYSLSKSKWVTYRTFIAR